MPAQASSTSSLCAARSSPAAGLEQFLRHLPGRREAHLDSDPDGVLQLAAHPLDQAPLLLLGQARLDRHDKLDGLFAARVVVDPGPVVHHRRLQHHAVDRLGPDVHATDLEHVVDPADRTGAVAGPGPAAAARPWLQQPGPIPHPEPDGGLGAGTEGRHHDLTDLAWSNRLPQRVQDLDPASVVETVQDASVRTTVRPCRHRAVLAGAHRHAEGLGGAPALR